MKKTLLRKKRPGDDKTFQSIGRLQQVTTESIAAKMSKGTVAVVLEPDVAEIFGSSDVVNALLRSIIAALPSSKRGPRANPTI